MRNHACFQFFDLRIVNTGTFEIVSKLVSKAPKLQGSFHAFLHIEKVDWKC